ncbi:MAG: hypothetical protein AAGJ56_07460 [Myxococcota bacterium]
MFGEPIFQSSVELEVYVECRRLFGFVRYGSSQRAILAADMESDDEQEF